MNGSALVRNLGELLALPESVTLTPTSLILAPRATIAEVDQIAALLSEAEKRAEAQGSQLAWWSADLSASDNDEIAGQVSAHFAPQTCANRRYVARHVSPKVRRAGLSFSHHAIVASLPQDLQDQLLGLAESEGFSRQQLQEAAAEVRHAVTPLLDRVTVRLRKVLTSAEEIRTLAVGLSALEREQIAPLAAKIGGVLGNLS